MADKSEADVALEIYQSVKQSNDKQKRLKSSTFWGLFKVKARQKGVVERIVHLLEEQRLKVTVKSDRPLGEERDDDWIILSLKISNGHSDTPPQPSDWPETKWFETMQTRNFESEREVEAYFIAPLLEKLGYDYDDIVIGYPVEMYKGVQKIKTEADFVIFN